MPFLAAMLAKRTHAPRLTIVIEGGQYDADPTHVPYTVGDSSLTPRAGQTNMLGVTGALQRCEMDVGFLGGAQIDRYGNLNSTVIGEYSNPKVRLPGSGGAAPIASLCKRTIILMPQEWRKFVEKVDFLTSPGYLTGPGAREEAGLPAGSGPSAVVSTMGLFRFGAKTKEMYLDTCHPGVTVDQIKENVSWNLKVSRNVRGTEEPTEEEIKILRQLDMEGVFLKKQEFLKRIAMQ
jgi:glutaconate CoA-transferase subunit B